MVRITYRPNMTSAVYEGRKALKLNKRLSNEEFITCILDEVMKVRICYTNSLQYEGRPESFKTVFIKTKP